MLVSEHFAQQCRSRLVPVGAHMLPGFSEEQRVFGSADEAPFAPRGALATDN